MGSRRGRWGGVCNSIQLSESIVVFTTRIAEILHPLTCSCEVDVVVEKYEGVVDLEVSRVEVEACRVVELEACPVDVVSTKSEIVGCSTP